MTTAPGINPLAGHPSATPAPAAPGTFETPKDVTAARAQRAALVGDKAWGTRYFAGDAQAVAEMRLLNSIIAGADLHDARVSAVLAGAVTGEANEFVSKAAPYTTRELASVAKNLREAGLSEQTVADVLKGTEITAEQAEAFRTTRSRLIKSREFREAYFAHDPDATSFMKLLNAGCAAPIAEPKESK